MAHGFYRKSVFLLVFVVSVLFVCPPARAQFTLDLGAEQILQAGGVDLDVGEYSTPAMADWDNDDDLDLIVGDVDGYVYLSLNVGSVAAPSFAAPSRLQLGGADLLVSGPEGCQGSFPRVVDWNSDGRKDLLLGSGDGTIEVALNEGTDAAPVFNALTTVFQDYMINRVTPLATDFDRDGDKDLLVGHYHGYVDFYSNEGTDAEPNFPYTVLDFGDNPIDYTSTPLQDETGTVIDVLFRSSPALGDLTGDGKVDLLLGNTKGELLLHENIAASNEVQPVFAEFTYVTSEGLKIDLDGEPRSRPFVADLNGDGIQDVLLGSQDGLVRVYHGVPEPATMGLLAAGGLAVLRRRRRA